MPQIKQDWLPRKGDFVLHAPSNQFYKTVEVKDNKFDFEQTADGQNKLNLEGKDVEK